MRIRKRVAALFSAIVMAVSMMSVGASANGSVNYDYASTNTYVHYTYIGVDGYSPNSGYSDTGYTQGANSDIKFIANSNGYHTISFSPSSGSSSYIYIYDTNNARIDIAVPKSGIGMPSTLTVQKYLSTGQAYRVKAMSSSTIGANGGFIVYDARMN